MLKADQLVHVFALRASSCLGRRKSELAAGGDGRTHEPRSLQSKRRAILKTAE
jgi:hypothetical protein